MGITHIDRTQVGDIDFTGYDIAESIVGKASRIISDSERKLQSKRFQEDYGATPEEFIAQYKVARKEFGGLVLEETGGKRFDILFDYVGAPLQQVAQDVLAPEGIISTAGWKEGMDMFFKRAVRCIGRQGEVNTHYAARWEGELALKLLEAGTVPAFWDAKTYDFNEANEMGANFVNGNFQLVPLMYVGAKPTENLENRVQQYGEVMKLVA